MSSAGIHGPAHLPLGLCLGWGVGTDPDQYSVWHSSQMGPDQLNQISYANPEVDHLLEEGRASCHQQERIKYYHRFQEVLAEDQPIVEISCQDQRNPIDTTAYEGESTTKDVTIKGNVKTDAGTVVKSYVFTLQRIVLKGVNGKDVVGRWVIANRKDAE